MPAAPDPLAGLTVLERGWLSSNNILIHAAPGEPGAVLVDTSHVNHAAQTVELVRHALAGAPLARIVNTHLHSDHCGGNAALQRAFGAPLSIPPGLAEAARHWDEDGLGFSDMGHRIERFTAQDVIEPGDILRAGGRDWQVIAAPGHDPHSVILFDADAGVLISADALWERGFGVVFPELLGEPGFDDVGAVLDLIDALPVRVVIPGHGAPFGDVKAALARSRSRLASFQAEPARHTRHAVKVLLKYHLMEQGTVPHDELLRWAADAPLLASARARHARPDDAGVHEWLSALVDELVAGGALRRAGDLMHDA